MANTESAREIAETRAKSVVTVNLPKEGAGGEVDAWIAVNGKSVHIPRGGNQRISRQYADVLRYRRLAQREADKFNEDAAKKMQEAARRTNMA